MRLIYALVLLTGFALPARADDAALKKEVEQLANSYMACFDKKDPSCIAGLYTSDGIMINAAGVHNKGPLDVYPGLFQAGFTKLEATTTQAHALGADAAIATGTYHITGKDPKGMDLVADGTWAATYVRDGGKLKVRMLTGVPKPPPAK